MPPSYGTTARYALRKLLGTNLISDIDSGIGALADDVDSKFAGYSEGPLSSRPTSTGGTPGIAGREYRATDNGKLYKDHGTGWNEIRASSAPASGKSIIATAEARTNTAYGLLTTPDRVQGIVVPADARVEVSYQALWKCSVTDAGRAALFIAATQLKIQTPSFGPDVQEALGTDADAYVPLVTYFGGLVGPNPAGAALAYNSDVTTGQVLGYDAGSDGKQGGVLQIDNLAAGTYDFSVQFKSASGSVTAKERRLKVRVIAF